MNNFVPHVLRIKQYHEFWCSLQKSTNTIQFWCIPLESRLLNKLRKFVENMFQRSSYLIIKTCSKEEFILWDVFTLDAHIPTWLIPVAGSNFGSLSRSKNFERVFKSDFKVRFTGHPTNNTLCLWSRFIYPPRPRIRTFEHKTFSQSVSWRRNFWGNSWWLRFWIEAEVNFFRRTKLSRQD